LHIKGKLYTSKKSIRKIYGSKRNFKGWNNSQNSYKTQGIGKFYGSILGNFMGIATVAEPIYFPKGNYMVLFSKGNFIVP